MTNTTQLTPKQIRRLSEALAKDLDKATDRMFNAGEVKMPALRLQTTDFDTLLDHIERQRKGNEAEAEARRHELVRKSFSREELFRLAYVPFVIAELVWDYADSVILMSDRIGNRATRRLSRTIRRAREEYERLRHQYIDIKHREREIENGYKFEEATQNIMAQLTLNIRLDVEREYPDLDSDSRYLLVSVYQCHITSRALLMYLDRQMARAEKRLGMPIGNMLPPSYYIMDRLIMEYVGDKPASDSFRALMAQYIRTYSVQMELAELNDKSPESDGLDNA